MKRYSLKRVLAITFACNRQWGWVSENKARKEGMLPTSEYVRAALDGRIRIEVLRMDKDLADRVSWWAERLSMDEMAEVPYLCNIHNLVIREFVEEKEIGRAASMVDAWQRAIATVANEPKPKFKQWLPQVIEDLLDCA